MTTDLTALTLSELKDIAAASGYESDDWTACRLDRVASDTRIVYWIEYSHEGRSEEGRVYVDIRAGRISLEF